MLAPRLLPDHYRHWNLVHCAPHGRPLRRLGLFRHFIPSGVWEKLRGPFAVQGNSVTREFEYPWAYHAASIEPGMRVLEIGGGLSGFQFVLSSLGCHVVNVDPGMEELDWPCDAANMRVLNKRFGTHVELCNTIVAEAGLETGSYEIAFSLSVLEHLSDGEITSVMQHVHRCLKPGGFFILTVDLYLNLVPFTSRQANEYGCNQDLRKLIEKAPFTLQVGKPEELYGFTEFDADHVLSHLEDYRMGSYPTLVQCLVLRKPTS